MRRKFTIYSIIVTCLIVLLLCFTRYGTVVMNNYELIKTEKIDNVQIKIDTSFLDLKSSSDVYFIKILNGKIHVIDKLYGTIKVFNKNGKYLDTYLGKKMYPYLNEIFSLSYYNNSYYLVDNYLIYKFNSNFILQDSSNIKFKPNILSFDTENPNPNQVMFYQLNFEAMNNYVGLDDKLIIPVEMELPKLNAYNTNAYYKKAFNFALLDTNSFKVKKLFSNWSNPYQHGKNYPFLTSASYSINKGLIFKNYEADTLIYVMDESLTPKFKFGVCPKNMNRDYRPTKRLAEAFDATALEKYQKEFGYFKSIIAIDSYTFRLYSTGNLGKNNRFNGLQIYHNYQLVAEKQFNDELEIIGYLKPFYYFLSKSKSSSSRVRLYKISIP